MTDFRLFQNESLQTTISSLTKMAESYPNGRKHSGKRRNCLLRAISPFPTVFSKKLVSQGRQKVLLCGNGLSKELKENMNNQTKTGYKISEVL